MTDSPVPNKPPRPFGDTLFKLLAVLILGGSFFTAWLLMDYQNFSTSQLHLPDGAVTFTIAPGSSVRQIAADLAQHGIIEKPYLFVLTAYLSGHPHSIKAGEYALQPGMHPPELMELFASGKVVQHAFTIVEGWSFRELRTALAKDEVLLQTLNGVTDADLMARLDRPDMMPEGWFLPDTYHYPRGTTDLEFLRRALHAMQKQLNLEWSQRTADLPYKDIYQALIMASIIEKETAAPAERPQIAGVFVRRLKVGMPLQTDPTIIYGMGAGYDGDIKRRDLTMDSPYNTYLRTGLTPTPIALPGKAALHAALHPDAGDALYFVSRGDGTHQFSATLDEHNNAVIKYQLHGQAPTQTPKPEPATRPHKLTHRKKGAAHAR
jgi:UPF0755 protein